MKEEMDEVKNEKRRKLCPHYLDVWVNFRTDPERTAVRWRPSVLSRKHGYYKNRDSEGPTFPRIDLYEEVEPKGKHSCECGGSDAWKCWSKVRRHALFGNSRTTPTETYPTKHEGTISRAARFILGNHYRQADYDDLVQQLRLASLGKSKRSFQRLVDEGRDYQSAVADQVCTARDVAREEGAKHDGDRLRLQGDDPNGTCWAQGALVYIMSITETLTRQNSTGGYRSMKSNMPATITVGPSLRGRIDWGEQLTPTWWFLRMARRMDYFLDLHEQSVKAARQASEPDVDKPKPVEWYFRNNEVDERVLQASIERKKG
jgi:hypothetical protein